jgi:hypothetical protein
MTAREWSGVWVSDRPLDANEGAEGEVLLAIDGLGEHEVEPFEWIEEGKEYREFLVPADVLNERGACRVLEDEPA